VTENIGDPLFQFSCVPQNNGGIAIALVYPSPVTEISPLIAVDFQIKGDDAQNMLSRLKQIRDGTSSYFAEWFPAGAALEASLEFNRRIFTFELNFKDLENACYIVRFESTISDAELDTICSQLESALSDSCK